MRGMFRANWPAPWSGAGFPLIRPYRATFSQGEKGFNFR